MSAVSGNIRQCGEKDTVNRFCFCVGAPQWSRVVDFRAFVWVPRRCLTVFVSLDMRLIRLMVDGAYHPAPVTDLL